MGGDVASYAGATNVCVGVDQPFLRLHSIADGALTNSTSARMCLIKNPHDSLHAHKPRAHAHTL
jgi:hypothetical protein